MEDSFFKKLPWWAWALLAAFAYAWWSEGANNLGNDGAPSDLFNQVSDDIGSMVDAMTGKQQLISTIADAIQQHEGWYAGSRSYRNNNPGNLEPPGGRTNYWLGQTGVDGVYAVFGSYAMGRRALERDISVKLSGHSASGLTSDSTIDDFIAVYAPASDNNNDAAYSNALTDALSTTAGVAVDGATSLGDLLGIFGDGSDQ